jgi:hypothetical protein
MPWSPAATLGPAPQRACMGVEGRLGKAAHLAVHPRRPSMDPQGFAMLRKAPQITAVRRSLATATEVI